MLATDRTSHRPSGKLEGYRLVVRVRKSKTPRRINKKPAVKNAYQSEESPRKILVTREIYTRSEHYPDTPPRDLDNGVLPSLSPIPCNDSSTNMPSPPPPSRASTVPQSATKTTMDGSHFQEDVRFRPWHRSLLAGNRTEDISIRPVENELGGQHPLPVFSSISKEAQPDFDKSETVRGDDLSATTRLPSSSVRPDLVHSNADSKQHLSCTPPQFQGIRFGRSAGLWKACIARNTWLSKSTKAQFQSSNPEESARIQKHGRVAIPRQIAIGRRLRSRKTSTNLRASDGTKTEYGKTHTAPRLDGTHSEYSTRDPELAALLHDLDQNRFSDSWGKFYEEQTRGSVGSGGQLSASAKPPLNEKAASQPPPPPPAIEKPLPSAAAISGRGCHPSQKPVSSHISTTFSPPSIKVMPATPTSEIQLPSDEARSLTAPNPGPRTSSKGGVLSHSTFDSVKTPSSISPSLNRVGPSNISRPRKVTEASFVPEYDNGINPTQSTDTLAKIEVELQGPVSHPPLPSVSNRAKRLTKNLSIDSGPSGSAPTRELPQLPAESTTGSPMSRRSSNRRHSRKHSKISIHHHTRNKASISSLSSASTFSPPRGRPLAKTHTLEYVYEKPVDGTPGVICDDKNHVDFSGQSGMRHSEEPTVNLSKKIPTSHGLLMRKHIQKDARSERVRLLKQRDLALDGPIAEETENDAVMPLIRINNQLDRFPSPPAPRPISQTSSMLHSPLAANFDISRGITANVRNARRPPSASITPSIIQPGTVADSVRLRETMGSPFRAVKGKSKPSSTDPVNPKKKTSIRSLTSNTGGTITSINVVGEHTPPSSDQGTSEEEDTPEPPQQQRGVIELSLRREIQEIRALMILQGRTIDKLQNSLMVGTARFGVSSPPLPARRVKAIKGGSFSGSFSSSGSSAAGSVRGGNGRDPFTSQQGSRRVASYSHSSSYAHSRAPSAAGFRFPAVQEQEDGKKMMTMTTLPYVGAGNVAGTRTSMTKTTTTTTTTSEARSAQVQSPVMIWDVLTESVDEAFRGGEEGSDEDGDFYEVGEEEDDDFEGGDEDEKKQMMKKKKMNTRRRISAAPATSKMERMMERQFRCLA